MHYFALRATRGKKDASLCHTWQPPMPTTASLKKPRAAFTGLLWQLKQLRSGGQRRRFIASLEKSPCILPSRTH